MKYKKLDLESLFSICVNQNIHTSLTYNTHQLSRSCIILPDSFPWIIHFLLNRRKNPNWIETTIFQVSVLISSKITSKVIFSYSINLCLFIWFDGYNQLVLFQYFYCYYYVSVFHSLFSLFSCSRFFFVSLITVLTMIYCEIFNVKWKISALNIKLDCSMKYRRSNKLNNWSEGKHTVRLINIFRTIEV